MQLICETLFPPRTSVTIIFLLRPPSYKCAPQSQNSQTQNTFDWIYGFI